MAHSYLQYKITDLPFVWFSHCQNLYLVSCFYSMYKYIRQLFRLDGVFRFLFWCPMLSRNLVTQTPKFGWIRDRVSQ